MAVADIKRRILDSQRKNLDKSDLEKTVVGGAIAHEKMEKFSLFTVVLVKMCTVFYTTYV